MPASLRPASRSMPPVALAHAFAAWGQTFLLAAAPLPASACLAAAAGLYRMSGARTRRDAPPQA